MYRKLEDNDSVACINLMMKSYHYNEGYGVGYSNRNEISWIDHLFKHITEVKAENMHYFTMGSFTPEGDLKGFFLASTFRNYYTGLWTMDVKDCIVDHDLNTAFMVAKFFDKMMEHMKEYGFTDWRADSVRAFEDSKGYAEFLQSKYNATISHSMRGRLS